MGDETRKRFDPEVRASVVIAEAAANHHAGFSGSQIANISKDCSFAVVVPVKITLHGRNG
jgi:hypothetical protein